LLQSEGVTHLFGNPGTTELPIMPWVTPIVILSDARRADGARHPLVASSGSVVP
jgi:hypothetical protein